MFLLIGCVRTVHGYAPCLIVAGHSRMIKPMITGCSIAPMIAGCAIDRSTLSVCTKLFAQREIDLCVLSNFYYNIISLNLTISRSTILSVYIHNSLNRSYIDRSSTYIHIFIYILLKHNITITGRCIILL